MTEDGNATGRKLATNLERSWIDGSEGEGVPRIVWMLFVKCPKCKNTPLLAEVFMNGRPNEQEIQKSIELFKREAMLCDKCCNED